MAIDRDGEMFLYVVQIATGPIKIGVTDNVMRRLREIRNAQPYAASCLHQQPGSLAQEAAIHRLLMAYNISGEWFDDSPFVRATLDQHVGVSLPYLNATRPEEHGRTSRALRPSPHPAEGFERIKTVKKRLANGDLKLYSYDRATGRRVETARN